MTVGNKDSGMDFFFFLPMNIFNVSFVLFSDSICMKVLIGFFTQRAGCALIYTNCFFRIRVCFGFVGWLVR